MRASSSWLKAKMWHGHRLGSGRSTWYRQKFGVIANPKSVVSALLHMDLSNAQVNKHNVAYAAYVRDIAGHDISQGVASPPRATGKSPPKFRWCQLEISA